jgi:thiamine-phosphate pyrophosphorylase
VLRCAITSGSRFGATLAERLDGLLADVARWAADRIDFIQLREKDLEGADLLALAEAVAHTLGQHADIYGPRPRLLVNGRPDIALAAAADGVHLTARYGELNPRDVRRLWSIAAPDRPGPTVSVSCHTLAEVRRAAESRADLILLSPIFEKRVAGTVVTEGIGLDQLREACAAASPIPVLALGGVTQANTSACLAAGAAGIAAIRLFAS